MTGKLVRRWVVSIKTENDDPLIFGPYTERKARELSDGFVEKIEAGVFEGEGWLHSTATPIRNPQTVNQILHEFGKGTR